MNDNPADDSALDELVAQYLEAIDDGRSIPVQAIAGIDPRVRERFIRFVELAGDMATVPAATVDHPHRIPSSKENFDKCGVDYGEFRVIRTLGVGGMGIVYLAKHRENEKLVAIKVLRQSIAQHRSLNQRFQREVQAIASLSHANIVPLVATGIEPEHAFLAMELVDGLTLTEVIAYAEIQLSEEPHNERQDDAHTKVGQADDGSLSRTPVTSVSAAECAASFLDPVNYFPGIALIAATIADALAVAHRSGIVHRDIKPSNILLDAKGKAWLTDFGLASFSDDQTALTMTGEIIGTPAYMSPEQTMGPSAQVDSRSDLYSLGATLYELATFQKPFVGNRHQILFGVMRGDISAPRAVRSKVPADLEAIILKAMAQLPGDRYQSATAMAEDLRRFAAGKLVHAKGPNRFERTYRWIERNPLVTLTSLLGLIATIVAIFIVQAVKANALQAVNRTQETMNRVLSHSNQALIAREQELRQQLYISDVAAAFEAFDERDSPVVRQLLLQHQDPSKDADMRGFAWHFLDSLSSTSQPIVLTKHDGPATEVALFPGSKQAISVGFDGKAHVFNLDGDADTKIIEVGKKLESVAVSSDGSSILTGANAVEGPNSIHRCDVKTGRVIATWPGHANSVDAAAISPDGSLFATADRYNEIQIHDGDGVLKHRIEAASRNESMAFFNSNDFLAAIIRRPVGGDTVQICDLTNGQMSELDFGMDTKTFAFSASSAIDSTCAVVAAGMDRIGVLQWPSEKPILKEQEIVGRIRCVDISPDGEIIAAGCDEGSVYVWDLTNLDKQQPTHPPQVIYASEQRITSVKIVVGAGDLNAQDSDPRRGILAASDDGYVRLWSLPKKNPRPLFAASENLLHNYVSSNWRGADDHGAFYMRFGDSSIGILDASLNFRRIHGPPADTLEKIAVTDDDQHIVVSTPDEIVRLNPQSGRIERRVDKSDPEQACAAMMVVGDELFALFNDHLMIIDLETFETKDVCGLPDDNARELVRVPGTGKVYVVTRLNIHELDQGRLSTIATSPSTAENYMHVEFSKSANKRALCFQNGSIRIESCDGAVPPVLLLGHRKKPLACLFLDDDRTLVSSSDDNTIRFWNVATGRELGTLNLPNSAATSLYYFPTVGKFVTTHHEDLPQVWSLTFDD
ncbi:WD40 repeat domain-containing serine/threonine protein kinase [Roseimaritima multifibrata]|nr:WD40 repeat domain-containing serine/threonine protein kinase [Roseimaritima multifibrata]